MFCIFVILGGVMLKAHIFLIWNLRSWVHLLSPSQAAVLKFKWYSGTFECFYLWFARRGRTLKAQFCRRIPPFSLSHLVTWKIDTTSEFCQKSFEWWKFLPKQHLLYIDQQPVQIWSQLWGRIKLCYTSYAIQEGLCCLHKYTLQWWSSSWTQMKFPAVSSLFPIFCFTLWMRADEERLSSSCSSAGTAHVCVALALGGHYKERVREEDHLHLYVSRECCHTFTTDSPIQP